MIPLSLATRERLELLFGDQAAAAQTVLEAECGDNLPFCEDATPESLERIRFAVLKMSGGSLSGLLGAVALAKTDWRDVLVAAGFATDLSAHLAWKP